jgi:hypothetical protein
VVGSRSSGGVESVISNSERREDKLLLMMRRKEEGYMASLYMPKGGQYISRRRGGDGAFFCKQGSGRMQHTSYRREIKIT